MNTITHDELKARLDRGEPLRLVMTLGRGQFQLKHIPGSLQFESYAEALQTLGRDEEIILYCSGGACAASKGAYAFLRANGYTRVVHYSGGLLDWEDAGYPLEGLLAAP